MKLFFYKYPRLLHTVAGEHATPDSAAATHAPCPLHPPPPVQFPAVSHVPPVLGRSHSHIPAAEHAPAPGLGFGV